ncbi:MAG: hypothetical protein QXI51_05420 [Candidatus Korarchaeum sp.]
MGAGPKSTHRFKRVFMAHLDTGVVMSPEEFAGERKRMERRMNECREMERRWEEGLKGWERIKERVEGSDEEKMKKLEEMTEWGKYMGEWEREMLNWKKDVGAGVKWIEERWEQITREWVKSGEKLT